MNIDFTGQVAVVTGSGTGIGYAAAELFARCGAAVVVNVAAGPRSHRRPPTRSPRWARR